MINSRRIRMQLLAQNAIFALLLVAAALLIAYLAQQRYKQWDLTQNARNTLSEGSTQLLKALSGPVTITAYATEQDASLGAIRTRISDFVGQYQRAKPDIKLNFVDPSIDPKATASANIRVNGEMVVEYNGRSEHLTAIDEQTLTNLLNRLARSAERPVMFLDGHGERKLTGIANHDLGEFGKRLQAKGFKLNGLNLGAAQEVPSNIAVLVIASPQVDLLPAEVTKLRKYVERGGNLLWLIDQEPLRGLDPLADFLGLQLTPGVVIDPAANDLKASATLAIAFAYANHPVTDMFSLNTAFPLARKITVVDDTKMWRATKLIEVAQRGWVETGPLDENVGFDNKVDVPGPVTVAMALERQVDAKPQRIVVTGSGHFLANTHAGLLGNLDMGINMMNWLAGDENLITLQARPTVDGSLQLSKSWLTFIALLVLVAIPGAFLFTGGMLWWRQRRA